MRDWMIDSTVLRTHVLYMESQCRWDRFQLCGRLFLTAIVGENCGRSQLIRERQWYARRSSTGRTQIYEEFFKKDLGCKWNERCSLCIRLFGEFSCSNDDVCAVDECVYIAQYLNDWCSEEAREKLSSGIVATRFWNTRNQMIQRSQACIHSV